ncbi:MAG: transporter substrate-binding domain-containing protein [Dysgonamonadaceae bacterium]|jgi:membrane-bound lytic murein transglycosylase F|nr:transporter substrate-binding domain-containing protein [Dysgonamonadaceae bacterium]
MKRTPLALFIVHCALFLSCSGNKTGTTTPVDDFAAIKDSGVINIVTLYSSISYFIYKGEPMGYEYELLKDFADSHHLKINVKIVSNVKLLTEALLTQKADLIAYNIPITNEMKQLVRYCGREMITHQVLVQRANRKDTILKDVTQLIGKEIPVNRNTRYYDRLVNLNNEVGGGILIRDIQKDTVNTEDLIEFVSKGKIPYTVSDDNVAQLNKTYYSNIDIRLKISHPQRSSWAVRKNSPSLAKALDQWFAENKNTTKYKAIMKRYFEMSKNLPEAYGTVFGQLYGKGQISLFDDIFKKYAPAINKDWRLLASIAFQESRFDTTGVSWAGAAGLMGLMPKTAEAMGISVEERSNPDAGVRAAAKYIQIVERFFRNVSNDEERIKLVLASYNAGMGHVLDAQALAVKYGKDSKVWDNNVEDCIHLKSLPEYYNDSICKHGYLRGTETITYVRDVMKRWKYYREKVPY